MQSSDRQEQAAQAVSWLLATAVHAGLFWLLTQQQHRNPPEQAGDGMCLVLITPAAGDRLGKDNTPFSPFATPVRPSARVAACCGARLAVA